MHNLAALVPAVIGADKPKPAPRNPGNLPALSATEARALLAHPPSPELEAAIRAVNGPLVRIEEPDPRWPDASPRVRWAAPVLPELGEETAGEARERLAALRLRLQPAPMALRTKWVLAFASAVEKSPEGEALANDAQMLAGLLELPSVCFLADLPRIEGEDAADYQWRRMVERVREVADAVRWWSSYAKLKPVLTPHIEAARKAERALSVLVERMDAGKPAALAAPQPEAPAIYLARLLRQPADWQRRNMARAFRARLRHSDPEMAKALAPQLDPLCDVADPMAEAAAAEAQPARLRSRPPTEEELKEQANARQALRARAMARGVVMTDAELRELQAQARELVDLSPAETASRGR